MSQLKIAKKNRDELESSIEKVLSQIGENPEREGLLKTPARVAESLRFLTQGYDQNIEQIINGAIFHEEIEEMIILRDVSLYSLCEHHLLPFFGACHIAYIPDGRIIGLSKLARIVEVFARRLQVQERLTSQIAETLNEALHPKGVAVVIEAQHLCMQMRGVQKRGATMQTSAVRGIFQKNQATREEFFNLISNTRC